MHVNDCHHTKSPMTIHKNESLHSSHFKHCVHECKKPSLTLEHHSLENVCANILASVALEEAALAHILNAEGEKIQKIVQLSCRPADLLAVNESVRSTIIEVTHLEHCLIDKIKLVHQLLSLHHDKHCH